MEQMKQLSHSAPKGLDLFGEGDMHSHTGGHSSCTAIRGRTAGCHWRLHKIFHRTVRRSGATNGSKGQGIQQCPEVVFSACPWHALCKTYCNITRVCNHVDAYIQVTSFVHLPKATFCYWSRFVSYTIDFVPLGDYVGRCHNLTK
jgi:hypothetical protein